MGRKHDIDTEAPVAPMPDNPFANMPEVGEATQAAIPVADAASEPQLPKEPLRAGDAIRLMRRALDRCAPSKRAQIVEAFLAIEAAES